MPRKSTPSFIHQLPLRTTQAQMAGLNKRFDVAHFAYNVTLQAMLQRLQAMRRDPQFELACKSPKATNEQRLERSRRFGDLRKQYGFSEYVAHDIVAIHIRASGYLDGLIDSHTAQTLASRAFKACEAYAVGLRGRPRFKRCGEIASIEGKGPTSPLQWKDDHLVWGGKRRDRRMAAPHLRQGGSRRSAGSRPVWAGQVRALGAQIDQGAGSLLRAARL